MAIVACTGGTAQTPELEIPATETSIPTATPLPTDTPAPTKTNTPPPTPTLTPEPPTPTATPTETAPPAAGSGESPMLIAYTQFTDTVFLNT